LPTKSLPEIFTTHLSQENKGSQEKVLNFFWLETLCSQGRKFNRIWIADMWIHFLSLSGILLTYAKLETWYCTLYVAWITER
jgi:hypothetical protein